MRSIHFTTAAATIAIAAVTTFGAGPACASTITYNYSEVSTGTSGPGGSSTLPIPGSYTYGNTFTGGADGGTVIPGSASTAYPGGFGFYDDYVFTIGAAGADAITSTIDYANILQVSGLQVRLYSAASNPTLPVLGTPSGTTLIDAWSTPVSSGTTTGTVSVLPQTTLAAGTYVLEVRGTVTGSAGGSYAGVLNLTPVPLPAALPLLLSGLGGLGFWARRRRDR